MPPKKNNKKKNKKSSKIPSTMKRLATKAKDSGEKNKKVDTVASLYLEFREMKKAFPDVAPEGIFEQHFAMRYVAIKKT